VASQPSLARLYPAQNSVATPRNAWGSAGSIRPPEHLPARRLAEARGPHSGQVTRAPRARPGARRRTGRGDPSAAPTRPGAAAGGRGRRAGTRAPRGSAG
jgi:hypothetical protein